MRAGGAGYPGLEVGDWRRVHDKTLRAIVKIIKSAGSPSVHVEPSNLFADCTNNGVTCHIRPDFLWRGGPVPETGVIADLKTLYASERNFALSNVDSSGTLIEKRQHKVHIQYTRNCHNMDIASGYATGSEIPEFGDEDPRGCLHRLRQYGEKIYAPVVNCFGALSSDGERIIEKIAAFKALAVYVDMNFASPHHAKAQLKHWYRRHISAIAHPAFADLLLARRRYARPRQHDTLERTSREAEFAIFGEEGPLVVTSAQEHPQSAHHPLTATYSE